MNLENLPRTHRRYLQAIENDFLKRGVEVLQRQADIASDGPGLGKTIAKVMTRGSAVPTHIYRYELAAENRRVSCTEIFENTVALPGEFSCVVKGSAAHSAIFAPTGLLSGAKWRSEDHSFASALQADVALKKALRKLSWEKQSGARVRLSWGVQVAPIGEGNSVVVMQTGSFTGLLRARSGISVFTNIVEKLENHLVHVESGSQPLLETTYWSSQEHSSR